MLLIIGVFITATAIVGIRRVCVPPCVNAAHLGRMSGQWLAEHRAAYPS